jgi:hypothetical protein
MTTFRALRPMLAVASALALSVLVAAPAMAHEARDVHGYAFEVGLIDEPVFVGQKSGLEIFVNKDDQPVEGLEKTLKATVVQGTASPRDLPLKATFGEKGAYSSVFIPTAAGKYTFHITGTLPDGSTMDETFTSSPTGFNEVQDVAAGQYPVQFPTQAELVAKSQKGADASGQTTIALALGALGVLLGLAALGVSVASRSRAR